MKHTITMKHAIILFTALLLAPLAADAANDADDRSATVVKMERGLPELPDRQITEAYQRAAVQNVLAAVNPEVFPGYWSVCADGQGFGYGNTYPSLDGHQMTDALLWLGQVEVVRANWEYVRPFQREDGLLPLAILPTMAGRKIGVGASLATVAPHGGLYEHWVPGNPLAALASPTYLQNADDVNRLREGDHGSFKAADGGTLLDALTEPKAVIADKKYPLVIFLHGAGGMSGERKADRGKDGADQFFQTMTEACLKKAAADVEFKTYGSSDHFIWQPTYTDQKLLKWLFDQKRQRGDAGRVCDSGRMLLPL